MRYKTAAAFRQALEERLRQQSLGNQVALTRLRKMVAFDRFLARLSTRRPDAWLVKGGLALQLRLAERARTTKDIDLALTKAWAPEQISARLRQAARLNLHDAFEFEVSEPRVAATGAPLGGFRFPIRSLLDGRSFEAIHADVGQGDPVSDTPEEITLPAMLEFAGIAPATVLCYPHTMLLAEKLHAYSRRYSGVATSRARDLADILLVASSARLNAKKLARAILATFRSRSTHALPKTMPEPPSSLGPSYRKLARELALAWRTIEEAGQAASQFLNPILGGAAVHRWDASAWRWK